MCIYQDKIRLGPDREAMLPLFRFLYWGAMMSLLLLFIFFFLLMPSASLCYEFDGASRAAEDRKSL